MADHQSSHSGQFAPHQAQMSAGRDYQSVSGATDQTSGMSKSVFELNPPTNGMVAFPGNPFKRKHSLREAIRSSKVAKRLLRSGKSGLDGGDDADITAIASEQRQAFRMTDARHEEPVSFDSPQLSRRPSIVSNFMSGLHSQLPIRSHGRGRGSSFASWASSRLVDSSDAASTNTSFTTYSNASKRSHGVASQGDRHDEDENEGGNDRAGKRPCNATNSDSKQPRLFACPFTKHDPERYSVKNLDEKHYRGCAKSYLTDLARVKQHLYRVHLRPEFCCPTCFESFKTQAQCVKHVIQQTCTQRAYHIDERITPDQLVLIKKKNRGTNPCVVWYDIYKTLFPGTQLPGSPFAAFASSTPPDPLETFLGHLQDELPARLQSQLDQRLPLLAHNLGIRNAIAEAIQLSLPDVLQDIRRDLELPPEQKIQAVPIHVTDEETMDDKTQGDVGDAAPMLSFHGLATIDQPQQVQQHSGRPSALSLPPQTLYDYDTPLPAQSLASIDVTHETFDEEQMMPDADTTSRPQPFGFDVSEHSTIHNVDQDLLTAIRQPSEQENEGGYFAGPHWTEEHVPTYPMQLHPNDWLTAMAPPPTTQPSMTNEVVSDDILSGLYHESYGG